MATSERKWWRNLFVIPLIVGLLVVLGGAVFNFLVPKLSEKKEISHSIDGPAKYLDCTANRDIKVTINGVATSYLFAYKVRLWNSGNFPIKNLPVLFIFHTDKKDFTIFSVTHDTKPLFEFGEIREVESDCHSKRVVYELLNPGDEDTITFLTNDCPELAVYAKSEGTRARAIASQQTEDDNRKVPELIVAGGFGLIISVVCVIVTWFLLIRPLNSNIDELSKAVVQVQLKQKERRFENIDREADEEVRQFRQRFSEKMKNSNQR